MELLTLQRNALAKEFAADEMAIPRVIRELIIRVDAMRAEDLLDGVDESDVRNFRELAKEIEAAICLAAEDSQLAKQFRDQAFQFRVVPDLRSVSETLGGGASTFHAVGEWMSDLEKLATSMEGRIEVAAPETSAGAGCLGFTKRQICELTGLGDTQINNYLKAFSLPRLPGGRPRKNDPHTLPAEVVRQLLTRIADEPNATEFIRNQCRKSLFGITGKSLNPSQ